MPSTDAPPALSHPQTNTPKKQQPWLRFVDTSKFKPTIFTPTTSNTNSNIRLLDESRDDKA